MSLILRDNTIVSCDESPLQYLAFLATRIDIDIIFKSFLLLDIS